MSNEIEKPYIRITPSEFFTYPADGQIGELVLTKEDLEAIEHLMKSLALNKPSSN